MKLKGLRYSLFVAILSFTTWNLLAQVSVDADKTAQQLAQKLTGAGIQVMNPVLTCPAVANGIFTVTSSNLGIDSGVVLTSGRAASSGGAKGVNGSENILASNNNATAGGPQLHTLP